MKKETFFNLLRDVPKAELHIHLEAVLSKKTVRLFYERRFPEKSDEEAENEIEKIFAYSDLDGFIQAYLTVQDLYENVSDFDYAFSDLKDYLVRNGIVYAEVFASPSAFIKKGFYFSDMMAHYKRNIVKIKAETGIEVRLLVDVSRTFGEENAMKNLQLLLAHRIPEIIGIGLGGSEQKGPAHLFGAVFEKARENNLHTTAHAGEDVGASSIWDAINVLKTERIGHGISAIEDEKLIDFLAQKKMALEICPTSNVFTKKYVKTLDSHPIRRFFDSGILVTINSDDPLFFGVELLDEYWRAYSEMGFSLQELKTIVKNSFAASFLPENKKMDFIGDVEKLFRVKEE